MMRLSCHLSFVLFLILGVGVTGEEENSVDAGTSSSMSNENFKNPYYRGCFHEKLGKKMRVCNSDDPPEASEIGICRKPPIEYNNYMELRIFCQNWESVLIETWVLQLILSEIMDVPTTVETGFYDANINFYDLENRYDYAFQTQLDIFHSTYRQAMEKGHELGDCLLASRTEDNYEQCAHMVPEICASEETAVVEEYVYNGIFDAPKGLGALGMESWFIPKFTAERDPTLTSYLGMQGEHNRQKMASMFKRPITWQKYCHHISTDNCEGVFYDGVAKRAPVDDKEGRRYFVEGLYTGYFMETEKSDCTRNNGTYNCTGHICDYPCSWPSYVWEQTQYLNIALESNGPQPGNGGYSLQEMDDIWRAANATKSNVIMQWWTPQPLHQLFHGTDAEFTKVNLPTPTEECLRAREEGADRCSPDYRTSSANFLKGSCDTLIASLYKMNIANLYDITYDSSIPIALRSPAYEVLELFRISEYQLTEIFSRWKEIGDPRHAVCEWAIENMDYMNSFIPNSYPRTMIEENKLGGIGYAAAGLAMFVMLSACIAAFLVYRYRQQRRSLMIAQVEFLGLLLAGTFLISLAAFIMAISASDTTCLVVEWIINVGYTLELVPLLVKVSAITRLAMAAQKMKRVTLSRKSLFGTVLGISSLVFLFMILWTCLDPEKRKHEYILTDAINDEGETIVQVFEFCGSKSNAWQFISVGWMALLLMSATILALEMRKVRSEELKESGTLAALVYSHAVFVLIRLILLFLNNVVSGSILSQLRSLIFCFDALSTILIYVAPKFFVKEPARHGRISGLDHPGTSGLAALSTGSTAAAVKSAAFKPPSPRESTASGMRPNASTNVEEPNEEFGEGQNGDGELMSLKALLSEKDRQIEEKDRQIEDCRQKLNQVPESAQINDL